MAIIMQKIITLLLTLCILITSVLLIPNSASAKTYNGLKYEVKNGKATIISYNGKAKRLIVPDYIKGHKVTKIGSGAFGGSKVKAITLGKFINSVTANSLNSNKFTTINVNKGNKKFSSKNGVLYNKKKTKLIYYPVGKRKSKFSVPKSVIYIGDYAFSNNRYIKSFITNKKLKKIGTQAFYGSKKLKNIVFSKSIVEIGKYAFASCKKLASVYIPKNIKSIKRGAFVACKKLKKLTIAKNKNLVLYDSVFANTGLEKLTFPKVKKYGDSLFLGCKSLKSLTIPSYVTEIKAQDFMNCPKLKTVTIPIHPLLTNTRLFSLVHRNTKISKNTSQCNVRKWLTIIVRCIQKHMF